MELLLNLAWLLLALPAYWLWRAARSHKDPEFSSLQCLLALACALVMLFPVISATDDLHAMRSEVEESPISKRSVRQAGHDKASMYSGRLQSPPAVATTLPLFTLSVERADLPVAPLSFIPLAPQSLHPSRAPPQAA